MPDRQRLRLVAWLQQLYQHDRKPLPEVSYEWGLLVSRWESLRMALYRCKLADQHGLFLCLPGLRQELVDALGSITNQLCTLRSHYEVAEPQELTYRHWYEEVEQLFYEFDKVTFHPKEGKLRVETPVITLGEICLGSFAIDFKKEGPDLSILRFEIVALQPEPAHADSEVVHPHVKDGDLCAGDAKVPIRKALESGRLADACLLILSTLQTYNSQSAYVKLEQWHGVGCSDCSRTISPDESYSCQRCQQNLCDECFNTCRSCSSIYCPSCVQGCSSCNSSCCDACLESSERTDSSLCRDCRTSCDRCGKVVGVDEIDEEEQVC